jgi:hypothetical protein
MNFNQNHMGYHNRNNNGCRQRNAACNCRQGISGQCSAALSRKIQEIDFAIYETVLYLDVYPYNSDALEYYHSLIHQREHLIAEYEKNHTPMTAFGNKNKSSWDWIASPWPWEPSAN